MFVMTTTNMNMKTRIHTLAGAAGTLFDRAQPRWLVWLTGVVALAVLVKIALVASQVFAILNAVYDAGLT